MTVTTTQQASIIRTERGLTIKGTRITLYQILDYIHANYPLHLICHQFYITDAQFQAAIDYIETHATELEQEYQTVLHQAAETQQYWAQQNQSRLAEVAQLPPKAEYQAAWEKLQAYKAKRMAVEL